MKLRQSRNPLLPTFIVASSSQNSAGSIQDSCLISQKSSTIHDDISGAYNYVCYYIRFIFLSKGMISEKVIITLNKNVGKVLYSDK